MSDTSPHDGLSQEREALYNFVWPEPGRIPNPGAEGRLKRTA
jgi:hypothetical protein